MMRFKSTAFFQFPFQKMPDRIEQRCCDEETKIGLILTDPFYDEHREFGRQTSYYDSFSEDEIAELAEMCGFYLKLGGHAQMLFLSVQLSLWVKTVSVHTESILFGDAEGFLQEHDEAKFYQEKQFLVYVRDWQNFGWNLAWRYHYHVSMVEHAIYFWQWRLECIEGFWIWSKMFESHTTALSI